MPYVVACFGVLVVVLGLIGVAWPRHLIGVIVGLPPRVRLYVAVSVRLVLGGVFILAAPDCRFPTAILVIGIIAIVAAVTLALLGADRLESMVRWWAQRSGDVTRWWCVAAVLFGGFLVYCTAV